MYNKIDDNEFFIPEPGFQRTIIVITPADAAFVILSVFRSSVFLVVLKLSHAVISFKRMEMFWDVSDVGGRFWKTNLKVHNRAKA